MPLPSRATAYVKGLFGIAEIDLTGSRLVTGQPHQVGIGLHRCRADGWHRRRCCRYAKSGNVVRFGTSRISPDIHRVLLRIHGKELFEIAIRRFLEGNPGACPQEHRVRLWPEIKILRIAQLRPGIGQNLVCNQNTRRTALRQWSPIDMRQQAVGRYRPVICAHPMFGSAQIQALTIKYCVIQQQMVVALDLHAAAMPVHVVAEASPKHWQRSLPCPHRSGKRSSKYYAPNCYG